MAGNPNFHNKGGRPIYNDVYKNDKFLCYAHEKARALLGYFATSPYAEKADIDDNGNGYVILKLNDKRVVIKVSESFRRIVIGNSTESGEIVRSFYNYEFYLRHTIDNLIINATELILKIADMSTEHSYKLWYKS